MASHFNVLLLLLMIYRLGPGSSSSEGAGGVTGTSPPLQVELNVVQDAVCEELEVYRLDGTASAHVQNKKKKKKNLDKQTNKVTEQRLN